MFSPRSILVAAAVVVLVAVPAAAHGQAPEGPLVAVEQLFLGMRMGSASMAREVLASDVRFAVLEGAADSTQIAAQSMDQFLNALAASGGAWNEQIYNVEVRIDDAMASVWAPYTFYLNGRVSHCGVNSLELLQDAGGWKITQISDTRRSQACPDPLGER